MSLATAGGAVRPAISAPAEAASIAEDERIPKKVIPMSILGRLSDLLRYDVRLMAACGVLVPLAACGDSRGAGADAIDVVDAVEAADTVVTGDTPASELGDAPPLDVPVTPAYVAARDVLRTSVLAGLDHPVVAYGRLEPLAPGDEITLGPSGSAESVAEAPTCSSSTTRPARSLAMLRAWSS